MTFEILLTEKADTQLTQLEKSKDKQAVCKAVLKTLALMETNLKHPSLQTHQYHSLNGPNGEKVFESYVQNRSPQAWRIFWHYGPQKKQITVFSILPHP